MDMGSLHHILTAFSAPTVFTYNRCPHSLNHHNITNRYRSFISPLLHRRPFLFPNLPHLNSTHYHHRILASATQDLPSTVGYTYHNATNTHVYIVGCVHGSKLSADDVALTCDIIHPSAVVLELCESRLRSVVTDMQREQPFVTSSSNHEYSRKKKRKRLTFKKAVERFGGVGPAMLALGLLSISGMQKTLGLDPGREFKVGIRKAEENYACIVCGDSDGNTTVKKLAQSLGPRCLKSGSGVILKFLETVFGGELRFPRGRVRFERILRDWKRITELLWIVGPVLGFSYFFVGGLSLLNRLQHRDRVGEVQEGGTGGMLGGFHLPILMDVLPITWMILSAASFIEALLIERDKVLARNIEETCRIHGGRGRKVVAVVGLLHVNGILRILEKG